MNKIHPFDQLNGHIKKNKSRRKKIVLCHGVFDLLHIGHIRYFKQAKKLGDVLVVTITPDIYVNKGPNRPAFNQTYRSEAIAALDIVDFVSINEWPTAIETIKSLKPDLYVKGSDYKNHKDDVTGNISLEKNAVESIGGKIVYTSDITFSSSSLINDRINDFTSEQSNHLRRLKEKYSSNDIAAYFDKLKTKKVLVVGEIIIDEYVFTRGVGKSGKEPILVSQKIKVEKYAGGVLAVANNISGFCNNVNIISFIGDRDSQEVFIKNNINSNIKIDVVKKADSPTINKTRFIDNYTKNKLVGIYDLNDSLLNKIEEKKLNEKIDKCINDFDLVIVVDYGHGLITNRIANNLIDNSKFLAINNQINSFNIGYQDISKFKNIDYICINENELRHYYRNRFDKIETLIKKFYKETNSQTIMITRGNSGSIAFKDGEFYKSPAYAEKVVDRVGAGDILLGITSLCLEAGIPSDLSIFIGNLSAAETVKVTGTGNILEKVNLVKAVQYLLK